MSGHKKWSEIKHKRLDSIVWTGDNEADVEKFAMEHSPSFGFTRGSTYDRIRWYHRLFERLSVPSEDMTVLEIFPTREDEKSQLEDFLSEVSENQLSGVVSHLEKILIAKDDDVMRVVRRLIDAANAERNQEYVPWHWTTANPGDKILSDGTVIKYEDWFENDPKRWINQPGVEKSE